MYFKKGNLPIVQKKILENIPDDSGNLGKLRRPRTRKKHTEKRFRASHQV
jgi:hypothetical protein